MREEDIKKIFRKELLAYTNLLITYTDRMKEDDKPKDVLRKLRFKLQTQLGEDK